MSMAKDILKFKVKVTDESIQQTKAFIMALFGEVISRTPVDLGGAAGSWEIASALPTEPKIRLNKSKTVAIPAELDRWLQKPDQDIFIASLLPYIQALEHGHSKQAAPGFMVRGSVNFVKNQWGL